MVRRLVMPAIRRAGRRIGSAGPGCCIAGLTLAIALAWPAVTGRAATGLPAGFQDATFATGLSNPTAMQFAPDGRLFVTQ